MNKYTTDMLATPQHFALRHVLTYRLAITALLYSSQLLQTLTPVQATAIAITQLRISFTNVTVSGPQSTECLMLMGAEKATT
jgi:hypothetical protein